MSETKYKLVPTDTFLKDLKKKVAPNDRKKVDRALNSLVKNPYQGRKLKAKPFAKWRWVVWPYRIRYDIEGDQIILYTIRHRKEVYRD